MACESSYYNILLLKCRKRPAISRNSRDTDVWSTRRAFRGFYYSLMIVGWYRGTYIPIGIHVVTAWHCSSLEFVFPLSWEIRLTRNKRGERSERVRSWRKDKIGRPGSRFRQDFRGSSTRFPHDARMIPRNKTKRGRASCEAPRQSKTHDWEACAKARRRRRPRGNTLVRQPRRVGRSCNQMPDWIISIIWNVYGADKDPWCTSGRSLRRRTRKRFERSRYFTCVMIIRSAAERSLSNLRRQLNERTTKIALIVIAITAHRRPLQRIARDAFGRNNCVAKLCSFQHRVESKSSWTIAHELTRENKIFIWWWEKN